MLQGSIGAFSQGAQYPLNSGIYLKLSGASYYDLSYIPSFRGLGLSGFGSIRIEDGGSWGLSPEALKKPNSPGKAEARTRRGAGRILPATSARSAECGSWI